MSNNTNNNKNVRFDDNITVFEFYENESIYDDDYYNDDNNMYISNNNVSCIRVVNDFNPFNFNNQRIIIELDGDKKTYKDNIFYRLIRYMSRIFKFK